MKPLPNFPFRAFDTFVFRTPCFPLNTLKEDIDNPIFSEGLFVASPVLHKEWQRRASLDDAEKRKVDTSIQKYFSRAKSRCTPFGLFAGCSTGQVGDSTCFTISAPDKARGVTRLDMDVVYSIIQQIESIPEAQKQLRYYPNNSIYELGDRIRYVECNMDKSQRIHRISSVDSSEYLTNILKQAESGCTIGQLSTGLVGDDVSFDDAVDFIKDMIDAQLLKSELDISVTGEDPYELLLNKIGRIEGIEPLKGSLYDIKELLTKINTSAIGSTHNSFEAILNALEELDIKHNPDRVFQVDLFKPCEQATLSNDFVCELTAVMTFLNKLTRLQSRTNPNLQRFKEEFSRRYEDAEESLPKVLDVELGLGYPVGAGNADINPLLDRIMFPYHGEQPKATSLDTVQSILMKKYLDAKTMGLCEIELTDSDLPEITPEWGDTHDTIDLYFNIVSEADGEKVFVKAMGTGSSAAKLLGRFSHIDRSICDLVIQIASKEQELESQKLLAEVVHLPQSIIGNIVCRPVMREYEIPYLCAAGVSPEDTIPLSDIFVSVRNNRIVLRSEKLKKEIEPRLTMAHNYFSNALPAYNFFGDLQSQDRRTAFLIGWGDWAKHIEHWPRISYKKYILSRENWIIKSKDFDQTQTSLLEYLEAHNIPSKFIVPEHDNELLIDANEELDAEIFLSLLKRRNVVEVAEFIFEGKTGITSGYTNEFILSFYREK